jgi:RNA polymerase sigma-70 factor (ECF subfamily)
MAAYDADRVRPQLVVDDTLRALTQRFVGCVATRDVQGLEALLTDDVLALNDGGGRFAAAGVPVAGRARVARFHIGITKGGAEVRDVAWIHLNGLPALSMEFEPASLGPRRAARMVVLPRPRGASQLSAIYMVLVPEKLARIPSVAEMRAHASPDAEHG